MTVVARIDEAAEPEFSEDEHAIWRTLFARQQPRIRSWACRDYLDGWAIIGLPADRIPTLQELNARITPRTGWKTIRTSVRYTDAVPWYRRFAMREFPVTDYLRSWTELEFTPEPDLFHDIFGHLPLLTLPHYAALEELFAPAFLQANDEQREEIKRLAWYSTEFGLIREDGHIKAFGAGLLSSVAELESVMTGGVPTMPFEIEEVILHEKSVWSHNEVIFVIDSIDVLIRDLKRYFARVSPTSSPRPRRSPRRGPGTDGRATVRS